MRNKLYLASIVIIIFIFLSSIINVGCKASGEKEDTGGEEVQAEEVVPNEIVTSDKEIVSGINDISVEEVYEIINTNQDYIILDVRTPEEFNEGHIEGAMLIPVDELKGRLDELSVDKPIIIYCKSGGRSRNAASILVENGFTRVYDMGGITDWIDKGYPILSVEKFRSFETFL